MPTILALRSNKWNDRMERPQSIGAVDFFSRMFASLVEQGVGSAALQVATDPTANTGAFFGSRFSMWGLTCDQRFDIRAVYDTRAERLRQITAARQRSNIAVFLSDKIFESLSLD